MGNSYLMMARYCDEGDTAEKAEALEDGGPRQEREIIRKVFNIEKCNSTR